MRYLNIEEEQEGEYYALLLLACIGMMFMASGTDLIVLFLGLETMALSFYVLSGYLRHEKRSNEAALKYLLLGAFSTGILAYGFSLLYGMSGSTSLGAISEALRSRDELVHYVALSRQAGRRLSRYARLSPHSFLRRCTSIRFCCRFCRYWHSC